MKILSHLGLGIKSEFNRWNVVETKTIKNARNVLSKVFLRCVFCSLPSEDTKGVLNGLHNRTNSPKRVIKLDLSAFENDELKTRAFCRCGCCDVNFLRLYRSDRDVSRFGRRLKIQFSRESEERQKGKTKKRRRPLL